MRILPFMKAKNKPQFAGIGIDSGGGGGGSGNYDYSVEPHTVGKWIDGRDVKEFSFVADTPNDPRDVALFTFASKGVNNLDTIISADIMLHKTQNITATVLMNYYVESSDQARFYTSNDNTSLMIFCRGAYLEGSKIYGTIRYIEKESD